MSCGLSDYQAPDSDDIDANNSKIEAIWRKDDSLIVDEYNGQSCQQFARFASDNIGRGYFSTTGGINSSIARLSFGWCMTKCIDGTSSFDTIAHLPS